MLWQALVLLSFFFVTPGLTDPASSAPNVRCKRDLPTVQLTNGLKLPPNYAASIRYSDWNGKRNVLIRERNYTDVLFVEKTDRNGSQNYVIRSNGVLSYNEKSCANVTRDSVLPQLYPLDPVIKEKLVPDSSSFAAILDSILNAQNLLNNHSDNFDVPSIGGLDAVGWFGCMFNATGDNVGIQVEIFFSGDQSQLQPYSAEFKNPSVLGVHFTVFNESSNATTYNVTSHYSFDVSTLDLDRDSTKQEFTAIPRGTFCDGMNVEELPISIPDRFGASIDFTNSNTKQVNNVQVIYDSILRITSFAVDFENDIDIPFLSGVSLPKNLTRAAFYRDFNYGIQYMLSKDGRICQSVDPLDGKFGDAKIGPNGIVSMKNPVDFLLNATGVKFYKTDDSVINGVEVETFVAKNDGSDGGHTVIEVNFNKDTWSIERVKGRQLHSIAQYHKDKDAKLTHQTFIHFDSFENYTTTGPLWFKSNVFPCTIDSVNDNFFYLNLQNATLETIRNYGVDNVECAIAEAIASVTNVSVLRVSYVIFKQNNVSTSACFILGEKTKVTPTPTEYLKPELSVEEFTKAFNESIVKDGFVVKLITEALKPAGININKIGIINPNDDSHPSGGSFVGYSGGSMFILGIFSFIFGGAIALGAYVFLNKRRQISGMAYQVFE